METWRSEDERGYAGSTCVLGGFHQWDGDFGIVQGRRGCVRLRCGRCGAFARHTAPHHVNAGVQL